MVNAPSNTKRSPKTYCCSLMENLPLWDDRGSIPLSSLFFVIDKLHYHNKVFIYVSRLDVPGWINALRCHAMLLQDLDQLVPAWLLRNFACRRRWRDGIAEISLSEARSDSSA